MFHVRAFTADRELLGNLDGQTIYRGSDYFRSSHYRALRDGTIKHTRVHHWQVDRITSLSSDYSKCIRIITNPNYREKANV
jgi:hypothetical protein